MCVYDLDVFLLIRTKHLTVLLRLQSIESDHIASNLRRILLRMARLVNRFIGIELSSKRLLPDEVWCVLVEV
jgi:hypothetical protein